MSFRESENNEQLHPDAGHRCRNFLVMASLAMLLFLLLAGIAGLVVVAPTVFQSPSLLMKMSLLVSGMGLFLMLLGWSGLIRQRRASARRTNLRVLEFWKASNAFTIWLGLGIFLMNGPTILLSQTVLSPISHFPFPIVGPACVMPGIIFYLRKLLTL